MKYNLKEQVIIVQDIRDLRLERVLQLYNVMGFLYYLTILKDKEIQSSYKLLLKKELNIGSEDIKDPNLVRILVIAKAILRDAYQLYSDTSLDQKIIQQYTNILNEFYTRALGKVDEFQYFKNALTLVTYFTTIKKLLVYYYQVVYNEDGYFTRAKLD